MTTIHERIEKIIKDVPELRQCGTPENAQTRIQQFATNALCQHLHEYAQEAAIAGKDWETTRNDAVNAARNFINGVENAESDSDQNELAFYLFEACTSLLSQAALVRLVEVFELKADLERSLKH